MIARAEAPVMPPAAPLLHLVTDRSALAASFRNALLLRADALSLPLSGELVDLTVTSPPYGADIAYVDGGDVPAAAWPTFTAAWMAEVYHVTKCSGRLVVNVPLDMTKGGQRIGGAVMSRPTCFQAQQAAESVGWLYKTAIVWDEGNTTTGNRGLGSVNSSARPHPVDSSEMILFSSKGEWAPCSTRPDDITPAEWQQYSRGPWRFPGAARRKGGHPAVFPEELPRRCIRYLSRIGDVVLDPFVGSGTTVAVAVADGRFGIGCDHSSDYLEMAAERIAKAPIRLAGWLCATCGAPLRARRRTAKTCSDACRERAYRQRKGRA